MRRKPQPPKEPFDLDDAEDRAMQCLDVQTTELSVYPSTPHTAENQSRIKSSLEILILIHNLRELENGD